MERPVGIRMVASFANHARVFRRGSEQILLLRSRNHASPRLAALASESRPGVPVGGFEVVGVFLEPQAASTDTTSAARPARLVTASPEVPEIRARSRRGGRRLVNVLERFDRQPPHIHGEHSEWTKEMGVSRVRPHVPKLAHTQCVQMAINVRWGNRFSATVARAVAATPESRPHCSESQVLAIGLCAFRRPAMTTRTLTRIVAALAIGAIGMSPATAQAW